MADLTTKQVLQKLGKDILNWVKTNCVDNLVSTSKNLPLSANQGRVLKEGQDAINQSLENKYSETLIYSSNFSGTTSIPNLRKYKRIAIEYVQANSSGIYVRARSEISVQHLLEIRQFDMYANIIQQSISISVLENDNINIDIPKDKTWLRLDIYGVF